MSYRLRRREPVSGGLRRLARKELRRARDELQRTSPPHDEAVHEARKSIKKVRAILQIIESDDGRGLGGSRKLLRTVNHMLSRLRDADAMMSMLNELRSRDPRLLSEHAFARVRRLLLAHKRTAMNEIGRGEWKTVDRELRKLRKIANDWRPGHRGFGALASGIAATHRRGRKAMARALEEQGATAFHDWRKEIKTLWYELRLIEAGGGVIRRDATALHRAETWLGEDHNAVVLCAELSKDASVCGGQLDLDRLRLAADRYQCEMREKAIGAARRIFRRKSRRYVSILERAWKRKRRPSRRPHESTRRAAA